MESPRLNEEVRSKVPAELRQKRTTEYASKTLPMLSSSLSKEGYFMIMI
jgi:hypothetical protein